MDSDEGGKIITIGFRMVYTFKHAREESWSVCIRPGGR